MPRMSDAERDAFLVERRYGILTTLRRDGAPVSLPVWYEWDGTTLRMFCHEASAKLKRLEHDARATLLVVNHPDEPENWVSVDGPITIRKDGGLELAERVFDRYYPDGDARRAALDSWRSMKDQWRLLELIPADIRLHEE
ncbi:MAG TPA: TIGR03618 family F420-dependent PPOX class oxidoreductase [Dehalococcoidia bacterium]|nr:TIGR03618 family F420-dependent PPOX class oxidoreductase [Dehalococcoidia bacterium]